MTLAIQQHQFLATIYTIITVQMVPSIITHPPRNLLLHIKKLPESPLPPSTTNPLSTSSATFHDAI